MDWVLDVVLVVIGIAALVNGYRAGLLRTAAGLVGLVLGGIAAYLAMPWVMRLVPWPDWRVPTTIAAALALLVLGAWAGAIVGRLLRRGARAIKLGTLDRVLGAIGNLLVTTFVVVLVASGLQAMGVPFVATAVADSRVLSAIDRITPAPVRSLLAEARAAALGDALPWIAKVLDVPTAVPAPPATGIDTPQLERAAASVVRISGAAVACGFSLSGSGFVVAHDRIITNAHVVAGVSQPIVEAPGHSPRRGRVVAFDQGHDLAVIAVSDLDTTPLPIVATPGPGTTVAVAGYPFGGPLALRPASIVRTSPLTIDVGGKSSTREVTTLAARIDHGNSGGPVLTASGQVGAVVFARSEQTDAVGYAIPTSTLTPLAQAAPGLSATVDSGSCAAP